MLYETFGPKKVSDPYETAGGRLKLHPSHLISVDCERFLPLLTFVQSICWTRALSMCRMTFKVWTIDLH